MLQKEAFYFDDLKDLSVADSVAGHLTLFVTWLIVNDCVKRAAYNVFVHDEVIFHR